MKPIGALNTAYLLTTYLSSLTTSDQTFTVATPVASHHPRLNRPTSGLRAHTVNTLFNNTQQAAPGSEDGQRSSTEEDDARKLGDIAIVLTGWLALWRALRYAEAELETSDDPIEFLPWDSLPTTETRPRPVERSCPITLETFHLTLEPIRIHISEPHQRHTNDDTYSPAYNNKWYTYDAIKQFITLNKRNNHPLLEPTTQHPFSISDLRRANEDTRFEDTDIISAQQTVMEYELTDLSMRNAVVDVEQGIKHRSDL